MLLTHVKEKAKYLGLELHGRLFIDEKIHLPSPKQQVAEKENISRMIKLEYKINAQIENTNERQKETTGRFTSITFYSKLVLNTFVDLSTPLTPESSPKFDISNYDHLCIELLTMLKVRMDLAYAEIIARMGGTQAFCVMTKASEIAAIPSSSNQISVVPAASENSFSDMSAKLMKTVINCENDACCIVDEVPVSHNFFELSYEPVSKPIFYKTIQREYKLLHESLPPGVWVRAYGNRLDLLSVMIRGPDKTPYEDGLFVFDIQIGPDYPDSPPRVHYVSYSSERLNPNLYVDGKVCISLLGTWLGRGSEVWNSSSTLLQLVVSIQGLILVAEPYYNEAGYEKQSDSQQGIENSRTYNEFVILKLVQSMTQMLKNPPDAFKQEVLAHFALNGRNMCKRLLKYCSDTDPLKPDFPLLPVSKGLKLSLNAAIGNFEAVLKKTIEERAAVKQ